MWLYEGIAYPVVRTGKLMGTGRDILLVKNGGASLYGRTNGATTSIVPTWGYEPTDWVKESAGQLVCPD